MDYKKILVFGYVHNIERQYKVLSYTPTSIIELIFSFYPKYTKIYGIGRNLFGQFGIGHSRIINTFQFLKEISSKCDGANNLYSGLGRLIIKDSSNNIYRAGCCLKNNELSTLKTMQRVDIDNNWNNNNNMNNIIISDGGNGAQHTIIKRNNKFYWFGKHRSSYYGIFKPEMINKSNILENKQIIQICCGESFNLFLSQSGNVYSCGGNKYGQCGIPIKNENYPNDDVLIPTMISFESNKITQICCGVHHSLCLTKSKQIYVFGRNDKGQIGMQYHQNYKKNAILNPYFKSYFNAISINYIAAGYDHSLVIDNKGNAYTFGWNYNGQIGNGDTTVYSKGVYKPYLVNNTQYIDNFIVTGSCGYSHTVCLTKTNQLIVFGNNQQHQCSPHTQKMYKTPTLLTKKLIGLEINAFIQRVLCSNNTTLIALFA